MENTQLSKKLPNVVEGGGSPGATDDGVFSAMLSRYPKQTIRQIYIIHAVGTSFYKIGISEKPTIRLNDLQTACPHELKLIACYSGYNHQEWTVHRSHRRERIRGEWFALSDQQVKIICLWLEEQSKLVEETKDRSPKESIERLVIGGKAEKPKRSVFLPGEVDGVYYEGFTIDSSEELAIR